MSGTMGVVAGDRRFVIGEAAFGVGPLPSPAAHRREEASQERRSIGRRSGAGVRAVRTCVFEAGGGR